MSYHLRKTYQNHTRVTEPPPPKTFHVKNFPVTSSTHLRKYQMFFTREVKTSDIFAKSWVYCCHASVVGVEQGARFVRPQYTTLASSKGIKPVSDIC